VALQGSLGGLAEEFFHDNAVTPHSIEFAMAMIYPDHPKAYALMQRQTRHIFRKDPGHEFPESQVCIEATEVYES
jgi:hypothetical protein